MEILAADPRGLERASRMLQDGRLVAFPTETVYGLGADARNADAVRGIFAAKGRPADNPLIVHLADPAALDDVAASVPPLAADLAARFWPGPLTVVVDAAPSLPTVTTGGLSTVAVRVPDHPVALALLARAGVPVAAPSANRSGRPSPTTAAHVVADLGDAVGAVVDGGACPVGVESTVVDARGSTPVILREGAVTREELHLGPEPAGPPGSAGPLQASPGTRYHHYVPDCRVEIAPAGQAWARGRALAAGGHRVGVVAARDDPRGPGAVALPIRFTDAADLARRLYETLRTAETAGIETLVVEAVPEIGIGRAVMDRLRRAAAG